MASVEFHLPDLGENISSGDVVTVLVAPGDTITQDQPVLELETDKAVIEVPSPVGGVVTQVHVTAGTKAAVGQLILTLESRDAAAVPGSPPATPAEPSSAPPPASAAGGVVEFRLPDLGENVASGDVVQVLVKVGDLVSQDQPVIELETDKAVVEVPSPAAGTVTGVHVQPGQKASVGQVIISLSTAVAATPAAAAPVPAPIVPAPVPAAPPAPSAPPATWAAAASNPPPQAPTAPPSAGRPLVAAAPSVRRLAREIGVDINHVAGTGPGGRVSADDVKAHARRPPSASAPAAAAAATAATVSVTPIAATASPLPDFAQWGPVERQPMSNVRRITAERLTQAWTQVPQVTVFDQADITDLERWRRDNGKRVEAAGGKLTPTAIALRVVAAALRRFPDFNASVDMARAELVYKRYCHVGVAVDTERGLLVPVIRHADQKTLVELAVELSQVAEKARARRLSPDDMQGGCFTISNLGSIGSVGFTPIINPPEVAILGLARATHQAVYRDGQFVPRLMLPVSLTFDHRLIDGAGGARFLHWVVQALENPFFLLLEG
jgi:pyruvate dehydrogenase E2 component (dihydrolipoamide acetyltransferase)